jgi:hypothetical protein
MNEDTRKQYQMCYQGGHRATLDAAYRLYSEKTQEAIRARRDGLDDTAIEEEIKKLSEMIDGLEKNSRFFGMK